MAGSEPFVPLFRFHPPDGAADALARVLASGQLASGAEVTRLEAALADWLGTSRVAATNDRSGALTLALRLAGVGPGDEVIVSPMSCLATTTPIANLFARPVWCDVDPATGMIDPASVAPLISGRTRAILLYHWAGDVGPLAPLAAIAAEHGVALIDDAAAALGAEYHGQRLRGSHSDFTVHSFHAVNPLGMGDGGALCCRQEAHHARARWLRRYAIPQPDYRLANGDLNPACDIPEVGYSFALTNVAAALGLAQFTDLDRVIAAQRANGRFFDHALAGIPGLTLLARDPFTVSGYWVYALRAARRERLIEKLRSAGIGAQRLHLRNDRYSCFPPAARQLPGVDAFDADNLCLPCGWWVGAREGERIVACLRGGW